MHADLINNTYQTNANMDNRRMATQYNYRSIDSYCRSEGLDTAYFIASSGLNERRPGSRARRLPLLSGLKWMASFGFVLLVTVIGA